MIPVLSNHRFQASALGAKSFAATKYPFLSPWIQVTRVHKFAGTMVAFWPFAWSFTIAARVLQIEPVTYIKVLVMGFVGASLSHSLRLVITISLPGAGCIWNDIIDREFDRQVERTRNRPIASGAISVPSALVLLFIHLAILFCMIWNFNPIAFRFGVLSIVVLPGIYPFMKRITYWPQAWLGLAINVGSPMTWLALRQGLPASIITIYTGCWAWTMWYDTIYACQDKRDDVIAGVKSTALLFGSWIRPILAAFAATFIISLWIAGQMNNMGIYYFAISIGGGSLYLAAEILTVDFDSPRSCWDSFHRNGFQFGSLIYIGALADYIASIPMSQSVLV